MDKKLLWETFMETGNIEVYLNYKATEGRDRELEADTDQRNDNERS